MVDFGINIEKAGWFCGSVFSLTSVIYSLNIQEPLNNTTAGTPRQSNVSDGMVG